MKRRLTVLLVLAALTMTGCEKIHQLAFDVDKDVAIHINEFSYKGHKYLLYERYSGQAYGMAGIAHDPDCPCHRKGGDE